MTFLVAAGAVVLQLVLIYPGWAAPSTPSRRGGKANDPDLGTRLVRFASYLTIWFNVLVAGTRPCSPPTPSGRRGGCSGALRLDALVLAVGGGVVHWFLLRPLLDLDGADLLADKLLHIVVPLLCLVGWVVFRTARTGSRRATSGAFLWCPWGGSATRWCGGAVVDWYPYPSVDVDQHGLGIVLLNCVGISALMLLLAFGARWLDRRACLLRWSRRAVRPVARPGDGPLSPHRVS